MSLISWANKVGLTPKTTRINQVWDDDMNEVKAAINDNYKYIDGMHVSTATLGRQTWQNNDKFSGWIGDRFVAGKVIDATALNIVTDIDNSSKIQLAIDGEL